MAAYSDTILFNSKILYIRSLDVRKVPATKKQVIGKNIIRISIPGIDSWENEININGIMFDVSTTADTQRDNLIADQDGAVHAYSDGKHNGNYYITDLSFADSEDKPLHYEYSLTILEE